jgi:hypothetical protein
MRAKSARVGVSIPDVVREVDDVDPQSGSALGACVAFVREPRAIGHVMAKTLYMVIEHFKGGDAVPVYRRFRERGRLAPQGLSYVSSWVERLILAGERSAIQSRGHPVSHLHENDVVSEVRQSPLQLLRKQLSQ